MGKHYKNAKDRFTQELNEFMIANSSLSEFADNDEFADNLYELCVELLDYNFSTQKYLEGKNIKFSFEESDVNQFSGKIKNLMVEYDVKNRIEFLDVIIFVQPLVKNWNDKRKHNVVCEGNLPRAYFNLDKLPDEFWTAIRENL